MNNHRVVPILYLELLMEILSWLPVKALMKFTCVNKSWKSLITDDPAFANLHLKRSARKTHVLLAVDDNNLLDNNFIFCSMRRLKEESPSMIKEEEYFHFEEGYVAIGSCNGLVCLCNFHDAGLIDELSVHLWNPATRLISEKSPTLYMSLPSERILAQVKINYGLGYEDSSDTYKVVVVLWNFTKKKMETMVHYIGDSCWKIILSNLCFSILQEQATGPFVGGSLNWIVIENLNRPNYKWSDVTLPQLVIVSFDISKEVYSYISLPEGVNEVPHVEPNLGVLGDHMCLFHDHERTHFFVWKMSEYGVRESWARLVSISYEHLQCNGFLYHQLPMCFSGDGDFSFLAYTEDYEVIMYNQRDNSTKYPLLLREDCYCCWGAIDYVESLVSPS